jgi:hypothetical protein
VIVLIRWREGEGVHFEASAGWWIPSDPVKIRCVKFKPQF